MKSNKTSKEIEAYNTRNAAAIEAGLIPALVQSPEAAQREARQKKAREEEERGAQVIHNNSREVEKINLKVASEFGTDPVRIDMDLMYSSALSFPRGFPKPTGMSLRFNYGKQRSYDQRPRNYRFNKEGKLNFKGIESKLKEHYEIVVARKAHEEEEKAKREAAKTCVAPELAERFCKLHKMEFATAEFKLVEGKVRFYFRYYPGGGRSSYMSQFGPSLSPDRIEAYCDLRDRHAAELEEFFAG